MDYNIDLNYPRKYAQWRIRFQPEVVSAKKQLTFFAGEARILLEKVVGYLVLILVQLWFDDRLGFSHPG